VELYVLTQWEHDWHMHLKATMLCDEINTCKKCNTFELHSGKYNIAGNR